MNEDREESTGEDITKPRIPANLRPKPTEVHHRSYIRSIEDQTALQVLVQSIGHSLLPSRSEGIPFGASRVALCVCRTRAGRREGVCVRGTCGGVREGDDHPAVQGWRGEVVSLGEVSIDKVRCCVQDALLAC